MKNSNIVLAAGLLAFGVAGGVALDRAWLAGGSFPGLASTASAAEPTARAGPPATGIKRTVLLTTDNPGSANYEIVMGIAELAPGASSGMHRHPGVEVGYVLEGTPTVEYVGRPAANLSAGQSFTSNDAHNAINRGTQPAKILAVYVVEKGKPLATPVP